MVTFSDGWNRITFEEKDNKRMQRDGLKAAPDSRRCEEKMNVEPNNPRERRALQRIQMSSHPAMRLSVPGLLAAALFLGIPAASRAARGDIDVLSLLLAAFFLWQAWTVALIINERRTIRDLLNRLTETKEKTSQHPGGR